jgi:hypothetical protein
MDATRNKGGGHRLRRAESELLDLRSAAENRLGVSMAMIKSVVLAERRVEEARAALIALEHCD